MKAEFILLSETRHFWISHYTYLLTNRLTHVHTTSLKFVKAQIYKLVHGYYLLHKWTVNAEIFVNGFQSTKKVKGIIAGWIAKES